MPSFRALEQLMMQTAEGRRLRDLYWRHTTEFVLLCIADRNLFAQARDVIMRFQAPLNSFLGGKGSDSALIPSSAIAALNNLWNTVTNRCSSEMRTNMSAERARFNGFQDFVGRNFAQWGEMLQLPVPSAPVITITKAVLGKGGFTAEANLVPGMRYSLFRSVDLNDWTPLPPSTLKTNGFFLDINDPAPTGNDAFYQLSASPP